MRKLVVLLSCLVCLTAAGRLGLERKLHWLQSLQHPKTMGQDNIIVTASQLPVVNQRQKFVLDVLLQVQKPLLNAELIDMGKTLVNQPEMYLEMDDDLLQFLEQCRQHEILGRNELYNDLNIQHGRQLLGLYKFLVLARDWTTFQHNVCFARLHMNPLMLVNALQMAIKVRADTQQLIMPALNEIMPQLFYDRDVIASAQNVDWLNLINGKPMATMRPSLVDVLGLRGMGAGLGMGLGLANRAAGMWRPWQELRMKMINEKAAMRSNIMGNVMGMQLGGGIPHLTLVSGGRSVLADDNADGNQMMIEEQQTIVVPVEQSLNEGASLTDDVDLNIFWNNVMTERLMQTMSGGKHQQKSLGGAGKMWNINNRITDVGDLTLDEVLKIQQSHPEGIWKRTTGVWNEQHGSTMDNENTEGEDDNWATEQDYEDDMLSGNAWMWRKLTGDKHNSGKQWTPMQTLDNLPVSDVNNQRLLHVNRRRMQQHNKASRMMPNVWNRNMDDENQQHQGMWNQRMQQVVDADVDNSMMSRNRPQVTVNPMRQGHWSNIGNGRMVADSDQHGRHQHGHGTSEQERVEMNRSEEMHRQLRGEQDNDDDRTTGRWNTGRQTLDQDEINRIERMQRLRVGQHNDDGHTTGRWNTGRQTLDQDEISRIERIQLLRGGQDNDDRNNERWTQHQNKQRVRGGQDNDEIKNQNWSTGRWSQHQGKAQERNEEINIKQMQQRRMRGEQDIDEDWTTDRGYTGRWTQDQQQNSIPQQHLRGGQDNDEIRGNHWNTNTRDNVQRWGRIIEGMHGNDDMWTHTDKTTMQDRQEMRNINADTDEQRHNINWSNTRGNDNIRRTNDDDNWVRHPRSVSTDNINTINNLMITPADELMRMRSGEIFIQNLQQMLARINMDKLALTLEGTQGQVDIDVTMSMMNPRLLTTNGVAYQQRAVSDAVAKHSIRQAVQELKSIIELVLERKQIDKRSDGDEVMRVIGDILIEPIESEGNGNNGNIWDALIAQVNREVYGIDAEQLGAATVLSIATGNLREPIYQDIVNELVQLINEYQNKLQPYTREQLSAPGVIVNDIDINRLVTYTELVDSDLINLIDQQLLQSNAHNLGKLQKRVVARQQRLNHQDFTITLDIESQHNQRVVVRTFLGPKIDATGHPIRSGNLNEMRQDFVQLDAFVKNLERGTNIFQRQSRDISWITRDVSTLNDIYQRVMTGQSLQELQGANCQFPQHLLIPRGTVEGLPVQLLVVVTPVSAEDRVLQQLVQSTTMTTTHLCGLGNAAINLDRRPLGFPLDRPISGQTQSLLNILMRDVVIEHESRVHGGRV